MVFSSITFLFYFLPIVLGIYYIVPNKVKNIVLLLASMFFYFYGEPRYIIVLIFSCLLNYYYGKTLEEERAELEAIEELEERENASDTVVENTTIVEPPSVTYTTNEELRKAIEEYIKNKQNAFIITMEIEGKQLSSEDFANKITELTNDGIQEIVFVIGSSCGIGKNVSNRANFKMSMSKMTFLHQFARLILVEQIYRAFKILKNETYHK